MISDLANVVFPWDLLDKYKDIAKKYSEKTGDKIVDLSVGTPVDSVPMVIQQSLFSAGDSHAYPKTIGTLDLRNAIADWINSNCGTCNFDKENIVPTVGSKEAVAFLPAMLGLTSKDIMVRPKYAYPTYDIGTQVVDCAILATDDISDWENNKNVKLVWINSPNNPTGEVKSAHYLQEVIKAARKIGAVVASDECYAMFVYDDNYKFNSILDPKINGGSLENVLQLYSLSKQMNMAGYRTAWIAGDKTIITKMRQIRKHVGLIMPDPIQAAMVEALKDEENGKKNTKRQQEIYSARHKHLMRAFVDTGYTVEKSQGALYLWVKVKAKDCWEELERLANIGIIAAPGVFYDESATQYLRVGLTAPDKLIDQACERILENL
ncbi:MAG: succinyldiaminopimelate transaminase [Candidatus Ancillula sp.]|jgi:succinyldiaminopimelate transaminase|nr:succinyldiaminopimelate transaminase [Candidatus Ancillula sp.]